MSHPDKRWVIVFLIYADFRTKNTFSMNEAMKIELNAMFGDILNNRINPDAASLYVILTSIVYVDLAVPGPPQQREMTLLYKLKPAAASPGNEFDFCEPFEFRTGRADNKDVQQHILQQVDKLHPVLDKIEIEPQDEIFLITWDHGNGFGVFNQESPDIPTAATPIDDEMELKLYPALKAFWDEATAKTKFKDFLDTKKNNSTISADIRAGSDLYSLSLEDAATIAPALIKQSSLETFDLIREGDSFLVKKGTVRDGDKNASGIKLKGPQPPEALMNGELARVIEKWLAKRDDRKVGVLLMLNCCMMNLHTIYSLRNTVKFLVAPQSSIDNPGYNYQDSLRSIYAAYPDSLAPQELADNIVEFSHNPFLFERAKALNTDHPETIDLRAIVNIRLDYADAPSPIDNLITTIGQFIGNLNALLANDPEKANVHLLKYVRTLCFNFGSRVAPMVDLPNFLAALASASGNLNPRIIKQGFSDAIGALQENAQAELKGIKTRFIGPKAYYSDYKPTPGQLTGMSPTGYSIYFPMDVPADGAVVNSVKNDELLLLLSKEAPGWKELLGTVYNGKFPDQAFGASS
jgi:hypothetical protein